MTVLTRPLMLLALTTAGPEREPLHWATLPNGVTIRYHEQGPMNGTPIVLVHGFTDSWQSYARVLPLLPAHYRVIAVDMRGHGGSDRPVTGYRIPDLADDVVQLLAHLDLQNANLVGHSLGSFVVREVARRAPRRVHRLVLIGSAAHAGNPGMHELLSVIESFGNQVPTGFIEDFQRSTFQREIPATFMTEVMLASHSVPPRVWREALQGLITWDDRRNLRDMRLPTLLMHGANDLVFGPDEQNDLLDRLPGSHLVSYAGVGHAPHWEVPAAFVTDLVAFVEGDQERR